MKATFAHVVANAMLAAFALAFFAIGLALISPLLDAAWRHFEGGQSTLLRWLVCTGLAMLGLGIIEWNIGKIADFCRDLRAPRHGKA